MAREDIPNAPPGAVPPKRPGEDDIAVDQVVDEKGSVIDVPPEKTVETTNGSDPAVGATSPTNWWRVGLIVLALLIALVIILQIMTGGSVTPTTTPDTSPITEIPDTDAPATDAPLENDVTPAEPATDAPPAETPPPTGTETAPPAGTPAPETPPAE